jgi:glutamine amidotransferase
MCRLLFYKGRKVLLNEIVVKPENSIVHQARDGVYHPGVMDDTHKRNIRVNGDGFGLAWYSDDCSIGSCLFRFVAPGKIT